MTAFVPVWAPVGRLLTGANTLRAAGAGAAQAFENRKGTSRNPYRRPSKAAQLESRSIRHLAVLGLEFALGKNYLSGLPTSLAKKADEH